MQLMDCLSNPQLNRFVRNFKKGAYLFSQGERATTMYLLLEGRVHLLSDSETSQNVVSVIDAGGFLGEKAILKDTPYQRAYSAKADIDTVALEIGLKELLEIQKVMPEVVIEILKQVLRVVEDRFDKANYMIRLLRSSNNVERLIHCILYLSRTSGRKFRGGTEVILNADSIRLYIDMDKEKVEAALKDLTRQRLIVPQDETRYLIPNEEALLSYVPELIYRLAV